jgi:hypothetical protein
MKKKISITQIVKIKKNRYQQYAKNCENNLKKQRHQNEKYINF